MALTLDLHPLQVSKRETPRGSCAKQRGAHACDAQSFPCLIHLRGGQFADPPPLHHFFLLLLCPALLSGPMAIHFRLNRDISLVLRQH